MPQGPPNPGFMQEKVQKGDFLKKPSWELKFFCCFRFLWISQRPGTLNWKWLVFLVSKILYMKCAMYVGKYLIAFKLQTFTNLLVLKLRSMLLLLERIRKKQLVKSRKHITWQPKLTSFFKLQKRWSFFPHKKSFLLSIPDTLWPCD